MAEIIVAILLHLSTVLGGVPTDKQDSDNKEDQSGKKKTEKSINGAGGSGNYQEG